MIFTTSISFLSCERTTQSVVMRIVIMRLFTYHSVLLLDIMPSNCLSTVHIRRFNRLLLIWRILKYFPSINIIQWQLIMSHCQSDGFVPLIPTDDAVNISFIWGRMPFVKRPMKLNENAKSESDIEWFGAKVTNAQHSIGTRIIRFNKNPTATNVSHAMCCSFYGYLLWVGSSISKFVVWAAVFLR